MGRLGPPGEGWAVGVLSVPPRAHMRAPGPPPTPRHGLLLGDTRLSAQSPEDSSTEDTPEAISVRDATRDPLTPGSMVTMCHYPRLQIRK